MVSSVRRGLILDLGNFEVKLWVLEILQEKPMDFVVKAWISGIFPRPIH